MTQQGADQNKVREEVLKSFESITKKYQERVDSLIDSPALSKSIQFEADQLLKDVISKHYVTKEESEKLHARIQAEKDTCKASVKEAGEQAVKVERERIAHELETLIDDSYRDRVTLWEATKAYCESLKSQPKDGKK